MARDFFFILGVIAGIIASISYGQDNLYSGIYFMLGAIHMTLAAIYMHHRQQAP